MSPVFGHGRLRLYLLKLLDEAPRHGYEVIRILQDRFMGVYAPSPGTIYPRLARLEEEGFVTHDEEDGRKIYRITGKGREEINRRLDELEELEQEIAESVSGIAREVTEDVRETVRSLREELTWATREMRREGRQQSAQERARQARDEAHERARRVREQMGQEREAGGAGGGARGGTRGGAHEGARGRSRREDEARSEREYGDWFGWQDWTRWTDWPGRRRRSGRYRGRGDANRAFESVARELGGELRWALRQAGALGEGAMEELRLILEDALTRIRTEVFGPFESRPKDETSTREHAASRPGEHGGTRGGAEGPAEHGDAGSAHAANGSSEAAEQGAPHRAAGHDTGPEGS